MAGEPAVTVPSAAKPTTERTQAAPAVADAVQTAATQPSNGDDHGQFGHESHGDHSPTTLTTSPDQPAEDADEQDGKSLAPALVALNGNLKTWLKDAGPDAAAEIAALPGARAAIERLLTDADPAVRQQASEVLRSLSAKAQ
jgi:hypothetical protein